MTEQLCGRSNNSLKFKIPVSCVQSKRGLSCIQIPKKPERPRAKFSFWGPSFPPMHKTKGSSFYKLGATFETSAEPSNKILHCKIPVMCLGCRDVSHLVYLGSIMCTFCCLWMDDKEQTPVDFCIWSVLTKCFDQLNTKTTRKKGGKQKSAILIAMQDTQCPGLSFKMNAVFFIRTQIQIISGNNKWPVNTEVLYSPAFSVSTVTVLCEFVCTFWPFFSRIDQVQLS